MLKRDDGRPFSPDYVSHHFSALLKKAGLPHIRFHELRHSCATKMKRAPGADKDKLALIGHSSDEMLRYYQDVSLDDLRRITDVI